MMTLDTFAALLVHQHGLAWGTLGDYWLKLRHGVSNSMEGHRQTLGIKFHDAT